MSDPSLKPNDYYLKNVLRLGLDVFEHTRTVAVTLGFNVHAFQHGHVQVCHGLVLELDVAAGVPKAAVAVSAVTIPIIVAWHLKRRQLTWSSLFFRPWVLF